MKDRRLQRAGLNLILFTLAPTMAFSQSNGTPPRKAVDITSADVNTILKNPGTAADHSLKIVDVGKLNVAVGVIHRGPTKDSADGSVRAISHHNTTETYIIISGTGTLVTGGAMTDTKEASSDSDVYKVLNGPSTNGIVKDGYRRVVGPGDIIIIPPDVPHGWTKIADHVDYLSVRPDPDHVLTAGYVNPAIKK